MGMEWNDDGHDDCTNLSFPLLVAALSLAHVEVPRTPSHDQEQCNATNNGILRLLAPWQSHHPITPWCQCPQHWSSLAQQSLTVVLTGLHRADHEEFIQIPGKMEFFTSTSRSPDSGTIGQSNNSAVLNDVLVRHWRPETLYPFILFPPPIRAASRQV